MTLTRSLENVRIDHNSNYEIVKAPPTTVSRRVSLRRVFNSMKSRRHKHLSAKALPEDASTTSLSSLSSGFGSASDSLAPTISSDALLHDVAGSLSPDVPVVPPPGSISSNSSAEKRVEDNPPLHLKKHKYFSEKNKNIFKKLLHPSYQERNTQYRRLFGHLVDPSDLFLISFSCAYQREILCQGRMYISQRHICFHSNIFGWETCMAINYDNLNNITKQKAALIFPNSIQLETKNEIKYFFASFVNRDKTYAALQMVMENRERDEDILPEEMWEYMTNKETLKKYASRSVTSPMTTIDSMSIPSTPMMTSPAGDRHSPTADISPLEEQEEVVCPCESHPGKLVLDTVFQISVNEMRQLLFSDSPWFRKFNDILKNTGYHSSEWATDKDGIMNRTCTYTMALNYAMGPKSCVVSEKQEITSLPRATDGFVVQKETQNSGVPYADHFTVQCSYCVTRINDNACRLRVHGGINYKKSVWSMVKGFIEKNTYQGLEEHYAALEATLMTECQRRDGVAMEVDKQSDNESHSSSVEDPTIDSPSREVSHTSLPNNVIRKTHVYQRRHKPVEKTPEAVIPDYGFYIRIIIVLLTGLLLLNVLLLARMSTVEHEPSLREEIVQLVRKMSSTPQTPQSSAADSAVLESLLGTVSQLAEDLQKLKTQREEL